MGERREEKRDKVLPICGSNILTIAALFQYYPRNARYAGDAITLDLPEHSAASLRTLVARAILNEYNKFHYSDWPQFSHLLVSG